jgi:hypothetical protein
MLFTAKASVTWSTPTLTHPKLAEKLELRAMTNSQCSREIAVLISSEKGRQVDTEVDPSRDRGTEEGGYPPTDLGIALMQKAPDPNPGRLTDGAAPMWRRQAREYLFTGAIGKLRKPKAHGDLDDCGPAVGNRGDQDDEPATRIVGTYPRDRTISRLR